MLGVGLRAYPAFLKTYAADPAAKPELRTQCATCHINPAGSGPRNEFGQAFAAAGNKITEALRQQFPDRFVTPDQASGAPQVSFVDGSESQVIIESGGKKFLVDAKSRTVKEVGLTSVGTTATAIAAQPAPAATKATANEKVYQQMDVRLISLPTAKPIEKGALYGDFTHRFPFDDNITNASELFGLDGFAVPSFGFTYGLTDRFHVGAYRSPSVVGRPILLFAGASLLDENKGQPFTAMGRRSM